MHPLTRKKLDEYFADVAKLHGVNSVANKFSIDPSIHQEFQDITREETSFLDLINLEIVEKQEGEVIGLDINTSLASVTDTSKEGNERAPAEAHNHKKLNEYKCQQVNFDSEMRHAMLDRWRGHDDFAERYARALAKQVGRDKIMMMFNGIERAANKSDRKANPLLQDTCMGILEKARRFAPDHVQTEKMTLGKGGDYENIDAMVFDLVEHKMPEHHQEDTELVVIVGRTLFHNKYLGLLNDSTQPTERVAANTLWASREVAGMRALRVPFFPKDAVLVTSLDNISIYTQENSLDRYILENPKKDRTEDYLSENLDFVFEDPTRFCFIDTGTIKVV